MIIQKRKKKYIEDTIDFSRALHQYIQLEKRNNPNNFLDIDKTLNDFEDDYSKELNSENHSEFILALFGKLLEKNGTKVYILKEKDKNFENIELASIQTLCVLNSEKKYNIHFDFGKYINLEILKNETKQKYFLDEYKKKISKILKIDMNRITIICK